MVGGFIIVGLVGSFLYANSGVDIGGCHPGRLLEKDD